MHFTNRKPEVLLPAFDTIEARSETTLVLIATSVVRQTKELNGLGRTVNALLLLSWSLVRTIDGQRTLPPRSTVKG